MPDKMCLRPSPPPFSPGVTGMNTLVAMTASSRVRYFEHQSPGGHLAGSARIRVCSVEEGHSTLDGGSHDRLGGVFVNDPGPLALVPEPHHAETDPRDPQT